MIIKKGRFNFTNDIAVTLGIPYETAEDLKIKYDLSKPNGVKRKILDLTIAKKYGWKATTSLDQAFDLVYENFLTTVKKSN